MVIHKLMVVTILLSFSMGCLGGIRMGDGDSRLAGGADPVGTPSGVGEAYTPESVIESPQMIQWASLRQVSIRSTTYRALVQLRPTSTRDGLLEMMQVLENE